MYKSSTNIFVEDVEFASIINLINNYSTNMFVEDVEFAQLSTRYLNPQQI
jgi:hypothetical protein